MYFAINQNADVRAGKYDLRSIKACISGSAPLSPEIRRDFEKFTGGKLVEGYGLTEAPTATHCNPIQGENRNGSIGLPLPDVECRLLNLPELADDCGELLVRGPQVISEYYRQPDESAAIFLDGWREQGILPDG
jgi:long-chain acyl-CoA synthetase